MESIGASERAFARINLEQCRKQAKELFKAFKAGDPKALERVRWGHPRFRRISSAQFMAEKFALADAQLVIARSHHIESWPKLLQYIDAIDNANPVVSRFENAADAIVGGNVDRLESMLRETPQLITQRSTRQHASTLLHYISANGVEDYRQITPPDIVRIATFLLDSGADVDAESNAYGGGSTTLGLTATSAHPRLAGVQIALMDLLFDRGATVEPITAGNSTISRCLANGCPEAAVHLVARRATVDNLYGAAGLGRLDVVQQLFPQALAKEREIAMILAAQCDHREVVEFMVDNGVDPAFADDMTALHWACANGNLPLMEILLARGAPLEAQNEFGGTVLDSTLWFAYHALPEDFRKRNYPAVLDHLIAAGARVDRYPTMQEDIAGVHQRAKR